MVVEYKGRPNTRSSPFLDLPAREKGLVAFNNLLTDDDGQVRRLGLLYSDDPTPSLLVFSGKLAELASDAPVKPVTENGYATRLNYCEGLRRLNYADLLKQPKLDLEGTVCLLGTVDPASNDLHQTPLGNKTGLEIHAAALNTFLTGNYLRRPSLWVEVTIHLIAVVGAVLMGSRSAMWWHLTGFALAFFYLTGVVLMFVNRGLILPLSTVYLAAGLAGSLAYGLAHQSLVRSRRHIRSLLGRYVSPQVMRTLLDHPESLELEGEKRVLTVLFSDIDGFTQTCEGCPPEEVVARLNRYFSEMIAIVDQHGGTVKQFIGDELMVLFGAPDHQPDHARLAVETAVAMQRRLDWLKNHSHLPGFFEVKIGIHTGEVVIGNIGSQHRMEYTAIGDTVNLAARIEGLAGHLGERILVSQATAIELDGGFKLEEQGSHRLKGKSEEVEVYSVLWRPGQAARS